MCLLINLIEIKFQKNILVGIRKAVMRVMVIVTNQHRLDVNHLPLNRNVVKNQPPPMIVQMRRGKQFNFKLIIYLLIALFWWRPVKNLSVIRLIIFKLTKIYISPICVY